MKKTALLLTAAAALLATSVAAQETIAPGANVSVVFDQDLPNVPGKSMRAVLVEYEPGAGSPLTSSPVLGLHLCAGVGRSDPQQSERRARAYVSGWRELDGEAW